MTALPGLQREIIDFWRAVEMFSPPGMPAASRSQRVFDLAADKPLPWDANHEIHREEKLKKDLTWRHTVYVGIYPLESVYKALRSIFSPDAESFEERPSGESALLGFTVSDDGTLLKGSVVLSACAWATARAHEPGPASAGWLDGFARLAGGFAAQLEGLYLDDDEDGTGEAAALDWDSLMECREMAVEALEVDGVLRVEGVRVRSDVVSRRNAKAVEHDFLNSFIADDLAQVAGAAGREEAGPALCDYMRSTEDLDVSGRVDVRTQLHEVLYATDPDRVPSGRWPASPDRPLALGQQLAVNEAVAMPRTGGHLFAVNGPPGTGKTTMLRDLIAALVTERAERLAELPDPSDAFTGEKHRWKTTRYQRVVHCLEPELTGFELVVASSNNGAVENVTLEIPSAKAIDAPWLERAQQVDYFPLLAGRAMNGGHHAGGDASHMADQAAWGLIAARLGNSRNRRDFVNAVWWPEHGKDTDDRPPLPGLREILTAWEECPDDVSWTDAVESFGRARDRVEKIRDERLRTREALDHLVELAPELEKAREAERVARERVEASRPRYKELTASSRTHEGDRQRWTEARESERQRPCFLRFRRRAAWDARDRRLAADIAKADAQLHEIGKELRALEGEVRVHEEANTALAAAERALDECHQVLSRYREQPGAQLPDRAWARDRQARERRAPWTDAEWNEARTELFLEALNLHRAFLVHAAEPMRETLDGAMEIIAGGAPPELQGEAALAAWQALFLLVPVVSTTFASVPRLFKSLGAETLGWLLVDEAGQATPQNVVGALWRCRRAVIVGDPLQLEPITTIPFKAEQAIRAHYDVDEEWLTGRGSVQHLADRTNRLGTTLRNAGRSVWVGAPLTVHRRCDQPMFDLSNAIAYDGLMIDATDPALGQEFSARYPTLPQSEWIDVSSDGSRGNWIPAEGVEVDRILAHLEELEFDFSRVMAISPFRHAAERLRKRKRKHRGLEAGTIHTAQGKEADVVILALGSNPANDGARAWAASSPNLLNVAVSRARHRLYVIGDRDAWKRHQYFRVLADRMRNGSNPT